MDGYGCWCGRYGLGCLGLVSWMMDLEGGRWSPSKGCCGVKDVLRWSGVDWGWKAGGAEDVE